jgi:hypothetical protein
MSYNPLAEQFDKLKSKLEDNKPKGPKELWSGLINAEITLYLRNGQSLKGILRKVAPYEILLETLEGPLIVMKHSVDIIKEVSH